MTGESADLCTSDFKVEYSAKDAILYAVSVGFGSGAENYESDLRFLYEKHSDFAVVPTLCLSWVFWARNNGIVGTSSTIPSFPPPMMQSMGVLPKELLKDHVSLEDYPILHTAQDITWHDTMPVPRHSTVSVVLRGRFLAVAPKSVGCFVTTELNVYENRGDPRKLCTVRSTALILGLPSEFVHRFQHPSYVSLTNDALSRSQNDMLLFESDCEIASNATVLYRLTSGDSNRIHVLANAVPFLALDDGASVSRPLLHGLCTLGIATRMILQQLSLRHMTIRRVRGKFKNPVYVGDTIVVRAWIQNHSIERVHHILFSVQNKKSLDVLLDDGIAVLIPVEQAAIVSRL